VGSLSLGLRGLSIFGGYHGMPAEFWKPEHMYAAGYAHRGWVVGQGPVSHKSVPADLFTFARRFHRGLGPDEFPAILQKGERVIPKDAKPSIEINLINESNLPLQASQRGAPTLDGEKWVINVVLDNIRNYGALRHAIAGVRGGA
jgi:hypothetical protein